MTYVAANDNYVIQEKSKKLPATKKRVKSVRKDELLDNGDIK